MDLYKHGLIYMMNGSLNEEMELKLTSEMLHLGHFLPIEIPFIL